MPVLIVNNLTPLSFLSRIISLIYRNMGQAELFRCPTPLYVGGYAERGFISDISSILFPIHPANHWYNNSLG